MAPFDEIVFGVIQGEYDRLKTSGNTTDADKLRNQSELFITRSQFCVPLERLVKQELDQTVNLFQHSLRFNPAKLSEQCEVISWKLPSIFTDQSIGSGEPDLLNYTPEIIAMRRGDNWETKILNNATSRSISICEDTDQIKGQRTPTKPVIHYVLEKAGPGYGRGVNALHAISNAVGNTAVLITADEFDDLSEANIQATFERSEKEGTPFCLIPQGLRELGETCLIEAIASQRSNLGAHTALAFSLTWIILTLVIYEQELATYKLPARCLYIPSVNCLQ